MPQGRGYTLEELQAAGAKPAKQGLTLEQLQGQGLPAAPNLAQKIFSSIAQRGENVVSELQSGRSPIVSGVKATAQGFEAIGDVITETAKAAPVVGPVIEKGLETVGKGFSALVGKLAGTRFFKEAAADPEGPGKIEELLEVLKGGGDIAGNILAAEGVRAGAVKGAEKTQELYKAITTQTEKTIEKNVLKTFEKGVKPNLPGKTTPRQLANYKKDVVKGVKTIQQNKESLSFIDDVEGTIKGQTPTTVQQFADAIEQTKKVVFQSYDDLAKKAGEAGVKVKLDSIASELDDVIQSKSLAITSPESITYAQAAKDRLIRAGSLDAKTAQEVIQNYNNSLQAFYRNPGYDTVSRAAIDAMLANKMRSALDEGINAVTGSQYQVLKNQYGALKAIERDVVKASLREARRNIKGLIDYSDILSGGQVINGILSWNPATIGQGLTQKAIAQFYKYLNDPNRAIQKMFQQIEKLEGAPSVNPAVDFLKNIQPGLSLKDVTSNIKTIAAKLDDTDRTILAKYWNKINNKQQLGIQEVKQANSILEPVGKELKMDLVNASISDQADIIRMLMREAPEGLTGGLALEVRSLKSLAQEARKYKSAEEFVNSQQKVFRGGALTVKGINRTGLSVSTDKIIAEKFPISLPKAQRLMTPKEFQILKPSEVSVRLAKEKEIRRAGVQELFIQSSAKILHAENIPKNLLKFDSVNKKTIPKSLKREEEYQAIVDYARLRGFDAIDLTRFGEKEMRILNQDILKTKSQLTDFYNQVVKKKK